MVRKKCEWYPGATYHITTRGNRRSDLFKDGEDYVIYLAIIKEVKNKSGFELYCYCLMTNHVHLEIKTFDSSISTIMKLTVIGFKPDPIEETGNSFFLPGSLRVEASLCHTIYQVCFI